MGGGGGGGIKYSVCTYPFKRTREGRRVMDWYWTVMGQLWDGYGTVTGRVWDR